MFNKILLRFLLVLPFIGLSTCVASATELSKVDLRSELTANSRIDFREYFHWVIEKVEELEEDQDQKETFNKLETGNAIKSEISFGFVQKSLLFVEKYRPEYYHLSFTPLYIAYCVYRL